VFGGVFLPVLELPPELIICGFCFWFICMLYEVLQLVRKRNDEAFLWSTSTSMHVDQLLEENLPGGTAKKGFDIGR
jgi:hypothetical protein